MRRRVVNFRGINTTLSQGEHAQCSTDIRKVATAINSSGPIVTPAVGIARALSRIGVEGGRITLSEGIFFVKDSISITRNNITIVSTSPGATVLVKESVDANPMFSISGSGTRLIGLRFKESVSTGAAISITGDNCGVFDCVFENVHKAIYASGVDWLHLRGNEVIAARNRGIDIAGTSTQCMIVNNLIHAAVSDDIYLGDAVSDSLIVGNVLDASSGRGSYKGGNNIRLGALTADTDPDAANVWSAMTAR